MKTKRQKIKAKTFEAALSATSERKGSVQAVREKDRILERIRTDPTMQQRWSRYSRENEYARGIEFDAVIGVIIGIL